VISKSIDSIEDVGTDIVYAKFSNGNVILRDIIGDEKVVESAIIREVNVMKEQLQLFKHPMIGLVFSFLSKYEECIKSGRYSEEVEHLWEEVKSMGSNMVRELWIKLKGSSK